MEITLNELLDRTLVVPYDNEIVERLDEVCANYVADEEFNDDTIADLALMVLTHTPKASFKSSLEDLYNTKFNDSFDIPRSVCEMLAMYILMKAIETNDIAYNLALLNTMVIQNDHLDRLPHAELFGEALGNAVMSINAEGQIEDLDETVFVKRLFSTSETLPLSVDENERQAAQRVAKKAWYYDVNQFISSDELKGLTTYAKVFKGLVHIVESMPWDYYNKEMAKQIKGLAPSTKTIAKTVEEIIETVRPLYDSKMDIQCRSSVLLQVIADENHEYGKLPFMKSKLTVRQFAVWLYYELLLEKTFN